MTESNPFIKSIRESAGIRLAVLFGSFFILLIICSIFSYGISSLQVGDSRTQALITSGIHCLFVFSLPAFLTAKFSSENWKSWLSLSNLPKTKALVGVLIVYMLSLPTMEWLIEWNSNLHFPEFMSDFEKTLRTWEDANAETTAVLLNAHGFLSVAAGILIIGILTGFSEELFFRGALQGIFLKGSNAPTLAVWLSAIVFSTMHFQFFGFFPRLVMGVFFGYLVIWTGSLWVPIFAHALNNSMVVLVSALFENQNGSISESVPGWNSIGNVGPVVLSILLTCTFLFFGKDYFFKNRSITSLWQKSQFPPVSER